MLCLLSLIWLCYYVPLCLDVEKLHIGLQISVRLLFRYAMTSAKVQIKWSISPAVSLMFQVGLVVFIDH